MNDYNASKVIAQLSEIRRNLGLMVYAILIAAVGTWIALYQID